MAAAVDVSLSAGLLRERHVMNWPTAAVLIAVIFAMMVVLSTFIASRFSKK